jgi:hypothetical protein
MKNSNDTIGNRTRDVLACSIVPQPHAAPFTPPYIISFIIIAINFNIITIYVQYLSHHRHNYNQF